MRYNYSVDGREFEADRLWFRSSSMTEAGAEQTVEKHQAGAVVTVHHAPDDPGIACLEPGASEMQWRPVAGGTAVMLVGLFVGWFVIGKLNARLREVILASREDGTSATAG